MKQPVDRSTLLRFLGITLINAILFFSAQFYGTSLPIQLRAISGSDAIVGFCTALGTVATLIIRPLTGVAVDRFGRAPILFIGALCIALTFGASTIFTSVSAMLLIRFLYGFAGGATTTASNTIAADLIPRDRFGEWMGYFTLSQSFAMAIAPSIALSVLESSGFSVMMYLAAGLVSIVLILAYFFRQKAVKPVTRQPFMPYEKSAFRPAILMLIAAIGISAAFGFSILYGKSMHFEHVGLYFTLFAGTLFFGRPMVGRIIDRFGTRYVLLFGFFGFAVSLLMLWQSRWEWLFLASAALSGVTYGAVQNSLQTMAVISAPPERRGAANATYFSGFDAGIGLGSLIGGVLAKEFGYSVMFGLFSIPMVVGAVVYLVTEKKTLASASQPDSLPTLAEVEV
jgi:MFS family permease